MHELEEYLAFAEHLADAARKVTLPNFRKAGARPEAKDDSSPVTCADRACEKMLRQMLKSQYPQHAVFGEEFGGNADGKWMWALDPIDGTSSFISGSPMFCTLIALTRSDEPVLGVIDMPALDERWIGCHAPELSLARFGGESCGVSGCSRLQDAVMATTTIGLADDSRDGGLRQLCKNAAHVRLGGDAQAYGALASGFLDLVADYEMSSYDYLPLIPIVRAAGGVITDWQNNHLGFSYNKNGVLASASMDLHRQALDILAGDGVTT